MLTMTEEQLQAQGFQAVWNRYPQTRGKIRLIHNNPKNKVQGAHLKAMGMMRGISDHVYIVGPPIGCVWLECKLPSGVQSEDQKEFERIVKEAGQEYRIWRSVEELIDIIDPLTPNNPPARANL
jgi:hypothetical protein